jgi:hypothetical protein
MLKGGQALLVRWPEARHSRDIDLLATGENGGLDNAATLLRAAASLNLDDYIRFEHNSTSADPSAFDRPRFIGSASPAIDRGYDRCRLE